MKLLGLALSGWCLVAQAPAMNPVPEDVAQRFHSLGKGFLLEGRATPTFIRGDFDGDGRPDLALEVTHSGNQGLAIFLSSRRTPIVIAAGEPFFGWKETSMDFDGFSLHSKGEPVEQGASAGPPPILKGDALLLDWDGEGSGLVYWTGKIFEWYQQGE